MSNVCPATSTESSTDEVFTFEVDYGESEAEYAANFRALLDACQSRRVTAFQVILVNISSLTPEHYPSGGCRGKHLRNVRFLPPSAEGHWTEEGVRSAANGGQIHPLELLALCVRHQELGCRNPLLSSFEHIWRDGYGNRLVVYVSWSDGGRTFDVASDCGMGYSKNCRFPVVVEEEAKAA